MIDPEHPIFIRHSDHDEADFIHDARSGRLIMVTREPKRRGASIVNRKVFDAAVAENNPPTEPWLAFGLGILVGSSVGLVVTAIIGWCVWWVAK